MYSAASESAVMAKIADQMGVKFHLFGEPLTNEEVFAVDGALPLLYFTASKVAEEVGMDGVNLGCAVKRSENGLFNVEASNESDIGTSLRVVFCLEVLTRIMKPKLMKSLDKAKGLDEKTWDLGEFFNEVIPEMNQALDARKPESL